MSRLYYGWVVVAASMAIYTLIMGATYSAYGLFILPVSQDLHLSRADANTGIIVMNLGMMIQAPLLGMLLDRVSAKRVMILGSLVFLAGFVILSRSHALWPSVAVLALLLPFAFQSTGSLTAPLLIVRWFKAQRGRAMAISQLGLSLGGVLLPPVVATLIERHGWRDALLTMGVTGGALLLLIAIMIRERPRPGEAEPGGAVSAADQAERTSPEGARLKVGQILGAPQFWTINLSCGLVAAMSTALLITLAPLARARGFSMMQAASLVSLMSGFSIASMLLLAVIADRIDRIVLLCVLFVLGAAVNVQLAFSHTYILLALAAGTLGLMQGATVPMQYALLADRFGATSYGVVTGLAAPVVAGLGMVAMRFSGEVLDRTGGYDAVFMTFVGLQLVAAGLLFATRLIRAKAEAGEALAPLAPMARRRV